MWFKNLKIYRLSSPWTLTGDQLEDTLAKHAYQSGNNLEMQSLGWVPPRENGGLAHEVNGQILLSLRAEKKLLPGTVINQVAKARAQEIEASPTSFCRAPSASIATRACGSTRRTTGSSLTRLRRPRPTKSSACWPSASIPSRWKTCTSPNRQRRP